MSLQSVFAGLNSTRLGIISSMILTIYVLSWIDRQISEILTSSLQADHRLADTQFDSLKTFYAVGLV